MTATIAVPQPRSRTRHRARGYLRVGAGVFFVFAAFSALGVTFAVLALLALSTVLIWRFPAWAAVVLVALVPVNRFFILLVFHYGHSRGITTLSQLWKDYMILVLFARGLDEIVMRRRPKLHYVDVIVAAYLAISILYLFYPGNTGRVGFTDRLLGFRADSYFMIAYFVGRWIVFERRHVRWLMLSLLPGIGIVSLIAAGQFAWPDWFNRFFEKLSFSAFINGQGGWGDVEAIRSRGIAGVDLPRASSLLLGDLALAFFSVLAVAVTTTLFVTARRMSSRIIAGALSVMAIATVGFTVTRSAAIAVAVTVLVIGLLIHRMARIASIAVIFTVAALAAVATGVVPLRTIDALTNPHEASVQAHGGAIKHGLELVQEEPLGRGLGTAGTIGQRVFGAEAITTENWYLQIATEMGIVAAILFVLFSVGVAAEALLSFLRVRDVALAQMSLVVASASVGFFIVGNMLHVWEVPVIAIAFWMFAGIAVGARETDNDPDYRASA